jgi:dienelactone hydrolase
MFHRIISSLLIAATGVVGVQFPNVTGRYPVGTISLELIDGSRMDPFAPSPQSRDLMVSVYYPTSETAIKSGNYSFSPYISATELAGLTSILGTSQEIASIVTQSYYGAPITNNSFPVLIFSPGYGGSRIMYTAQLEDLASQGWIIIAVDHPYDSMIVEYPDGRVVPWLGLSTLNDFPDNMPGFIQVRVADVEFIAKTLKDSTTLSQIPGLSSVSGGINTLRTDRIGILGHSLGGSTAAQTVANSTTFVCGANLDGGLWGPVATSGLDKPFLMIQAEGDIQVDAVTWDVFWSRLSGFRREFRVNGTEHQSFSDVPVVRDLVGGVGQSNLTGTITGKRVLEIETALVDKFFAYCLKGKSADELDHLARGRFPEVVSVS